MTTQDARNVPFMARTKSFTRRSRDLPSALERAYRQYEDTYQVSVPRGEGFTTVRADFQLDPETLFGRLAPLVVEIGSGRGEQILHDAAAHPERDYLAFEVWVPGIARLVAAAGKQGLTNIRVIEADAQLALKTILQPGSVSELWTFFPDPWRKSRHHKRRLVSDDFAQTAALVLEDGGIWRMATDWEDYAAQMLEVASRATELENPHESGSLTLHATRPAGASGLPLGDAVATARPAPSGRAETPAVSRTADASSQRETPAPATGGFAPRFAGRVRTHFEERGAKAGRPAWDLTLVRMPRDPDWPIGEVEPVRDCAGRAHGRADQGHTPGYGQSPGLTTGAAEDGAS